MSTNLSIIGLPPSPQRDRLMAEWPWNGPAEEKEQMFAEAAAVAPGENQTVWLRGLAKRFPDDPRTAEMALKNGDEQLLRELSGFLLPKQPGRGSEIVAALPEPARREVLGSYLADNPGPESAALADAAAPEAVSAMAGFWLGRDPEAARAWADSLQPGATKDAAAAGLAQGLVKMDWDPAAAWQWAGAIADPALRQKTLNYVEARWRAADPAGAAWKGRRRRMRPKRGWRLCANYTHWGPERQALLKQIKRITSLPQKSRPS